MQPIESNNANWLQLGLEAMKGEKHRRVHIPCDDANGLAWLPWQSHGCVHGDKPHRFNQENGIVQEIDDLACQATPKRKPKATSSRQWEDG